MNTILQISIVGNKETYMKLSESVVCTCARDAWTRYFTEK